MFIGSSTEGLRVAQALQAELEHDVDATIWSQAVFGVSEGGLEALERQARNFDFASLVLTPDDLLRKRERSGNAPRDNVVFETGLFMGALGRARVFLVSCRDDELDLPTDLAGITPAEYNRRPDGNLRAAIGPAATAIRKKVEFLGPLHEHLRAQLTVDFDPSDPECVQDRVKHPARDFQLRLRATNTGAVDLNRIRCRIESGHNNDVAVIRHDVPPYAHSRLGTTLRPGESDYFDIAYFSTDEPIVIITYANGSLIDEQAHESPRLRTEEIPLTLVIEARREDDGTWLPDVTNDYSVSPADDIITLVRLD